GEHERGPALEHLVHVGAGGDLGGERIVVPLEGGDEEVFAGGEVAGSAELDVGRKCAAGLGGGVGDVGDGDDGEARGVDGEVGAAGDAAQRDGVLGGAGAVDLVGAGKIVGAGEVEGDVVGVAVEVEDDGGHRA